MLNFLKKIFQTEEAESKKTAEIRLENLEGWLNERSKPLAEEVRQQIEEVLMRVNEELQRARINVEVLENAKLQNPDIPFRAKQYMEGNRKAYIRSVNSFLGYMEINNKDYFYLLDFVKLFDELIIDLNKGTLRSFTILQEFFANETGKTAQNLKNFDRLFRELKLILNNKKMVAVNGAIEKISGMKAKIKQKINLSIDLKNMEASAKLAGEEKESIMTGIEKFEKSEEHSNFLKMSEDKKTKAASFYNHESQILQSFSALERPLRKYSHVAFEHEEIVLDYLKQPVETLADDRSLVILDVLQNLKKALEENRLQIDEKKKEKAFEEIHKLNREFLERFLSEYSSFKEEIEELDKKLKASGVPEKFRSFSSNLEDANLRIEKSYAELEKMNNDFFKTLNQIENLKKQIEDDIMDIIGEEIKIIV